MHHQPGNSGGALINLRGELIGINAALLGSNGGNSGFGFAIPISMVRAITDQLVHYGRSSAVNWGCSLRPPTVVSR
jgi:S1-C subfamily serine protease